MMAYILLKSSFVERDVLLMSVKSSKMNELFRF
jgi:hypothetical protein